MTGHTIDGRTTTYSERELLEFTLAKNEKVKWSLLSLLLLEREELKINLA